jgi:flagellar L-ring protein precursor FlgH
MGHRKFQVSKGPILSLVLILSIIVSMDFAAATSLWSDDGWGSTLLESNRAKKVGDLITIIVVEDSKAVQQTGVDGKQESGIAAGPGGGFLSFMPELRLETGQGDAASGKVTRQGSLNTTITAKITERLDNGNFIIEGSRSFKLNGEEQKIVLRGVVRESDISATNTILSTYIADAKIEYTGDGQLAAKQNPGILTRIFNLLF